MRQLSCHAPRDENEKYGRAYLKTMAKGANKLRFDMIDWDFLNSMWPNSDWDFVSVELVRHAKLKAGKTNRSQTSGLAGKFYIRPSALMTRG